MTSKKSLIRNIVGREAIKFLLSPMLRWSPLEHPLNGYSIMLGVPWPLRHLLKVNLEFVSRTDLTHCHCVHVVFDRTRQAGFEEMVDEVKKLFPKLPLMFHCYEKLPGIIVEKVNVSTFYNSLNCATILPKVQSRYAILHDFDLYPLVNGYFEGVYSTIMKNDWYFCGLEKTRFDGLTDSDNVFGTWCLGMNVQWLRSRFKPIDIFHKVERVGERLITLDPFSSLQLKTSRRGPVEGLDERACCHVKNLCSTFLRFSGGRPAKIVWRLHYLWYLEYLSGMRENFLTALEAMRNAKSALLRVGGYEVDFSGTDSTCANVLRNEIRQMENVLFDSPRPEVIDYINLFENFLQRFGKAVGQDQ